jgi:hypothetical protein
MRVGWIGLGLWLCAVTAWAGKVELVNPDQTYTFQRGADGSAHMVESCRATRYTSTGDKNVKASAGVLCGAIAASGTSVTINAWDDADGTCSSGQVLGTLTMTNGTFYRLPYLATTGLCVTVGGTSPDVTIFWK